MMLIDVLVPSACAYITLVVERITPNRNVVIMYNIVAFHDVSIGMMKFIIQVSYF